MNFEEWKTVEPAVREKQQPRYLIGTEKIDTAFGSNKSVIIVIDTSTGKAVFAGKISTKKFDETLEKVKTTYRRGGEGIRIITEKDEPEFTTYFKGKEQ
jgi:hypothetical protein